MSKQTAVVALIVAVVVGLTAGLIANKLGYDRGYAVAYSSEHSHFLFQKQRADKFARTIAAQRRCVDTLGNTISPVESAGFAGLGETMQKFGLMYWGTVRCNQDAGFGFISRTQYKRIVPSAGSN
jgi:hypothetical protein